MMNLSFFKSNQLFSIYLFAFIIPINPKLYGYGVLLILLELLIKKVKKFNVGLLFKSRWNNNFLWIIFFFIAHLFGVLYSTNTSFAWMDIGMKSSFILFPLFFALFPFQVDWRGLKKAFILGAVVSIVLNFSLSLIAYIDTQKVWMFRESYLSHYMHRGYWATYLFLAFLVTLFKFKEAQKANYFYGGLIPVFLITLLLTGSKVIIILLILLLVYVIIRFIIFKKSIVHSFIYIGLAGLMFFTFFKLSPSIGARFASMTSYIFNEKKVDVTATDSNTARILMWDTAFELITENPILGVGTGDIKDELKNRNMEKGYIGVAELNLNAHNQYLNTQLALGLFGIITLLGMFIVPFFNTSPKQNEIRLFIFVFLVSLVTESFLETQAGIIPVAFFLSIFGLMHNHNSPSTPK